MTIDYTVIKRENAMRNVSAKEGKCYDKVISKRGEMLWNVQQKRENTMKCSAKEGKCYEIISKRGEMLWNVLRKGKMLWNVQPSRENAMKCSGK